MTKIMIIYENSLATNEKKGIMFCFSLKSNYFFLYTFSLALYTHIDVDINAIRSGFSSTFCSTSESMCKRKRFPITFDDKNHDYLWE